MFRQRRVAAGRQGRTRTAAAATTWFEAAGASASGGALVRDAAGSFRLERTIREAGWPVGVASAAAPDADGNAALPLAALSGRTRRVELAGGDGPLRLTLLDGVLRGVGAEHDCCRLSVEGERAAAARLALALGDTLPVRPAALSMGELACRLGGRAPSWEPPAPRLAPDADIDAALAGVFGALSAALFGWADRLGGADGEGGAARTHAVHQARVATRRLRSATLVFREPLAGSLDELRAPLKALAAVLGAARDWDVFLDETGAAIAAATDGDRRIAALLAEGERARAAAHAALRRMLARPATRRLLLHLALLSALRPWREATAGAPLDVPAASLAPALVERRFRKLARAGKHLDGLDPAALHEVRKTAKKLRYALEFVSSALPRRGTRRFLRLLGTLQDQLGARNDRATGAALLARIAPAGGAHDWAAGAVSGWLAARAAAAEAELAATWRAVRHTDRFWRA